MLRREWGTYCVRWSRRIVRLLVHLPPSHHLLLEVRLGADSSLVHVRTDLWQLLAFVEPLLLQ